MRKSQTIYKKITIPFEPEGKRFVNGKCFLEKPDFFGVMINNQAVFLNKDELTEIVITEESFSGVLPLWRIENKSLELFIDTSDEPSLFS